MILTEKDIIPFFPDDNRFIHFAARKHGFFFTSEDDVESARYEALRSATKMVNDNKEYENVAHLNSLMEINAKHAILSMLAKKRAKKRSLEVQVESEFFLDGDTENWRSPLERSDEDTYELERDEIISEFMEVVRKHESPKSLMIFELHMEGFNDIEIAKKIGMSQQAVHSRRNQTKLKLRNYYEIDTWTANPNGRKVRARVRNKPTTTNKAEPSSHREALSYLGLI